MVWFSVLMAGRLHRHHYALLRRGDFEDGIDAHRVAAAQDDVVVSLVLIPAAVIVTLYVPGFSPNIS